MRESSIFSGGDGGTMEQAVMIDTTHQLEGIDAEYEYIDGCCRLRNIDWDLTKRSQVIWKDGRRCDTIDVRLADGAA